MGVDEARKAIDLAHAAQKDWAALTAKARAAILRRFFDLIIENTEDLARIITAEMGNGLVTV